MKEYLLFFIKGFIIGIAKILPGISGSALAISLGCYNKIIQIISKFYNLNKDDFIFCIIFGTGFLSSIFFCCKLVIYLLNNYYFTIILLFVSILIGDIIYTFKSVKPKVRKISSILTLLILIILYIFLDSCKFSYKLKINKFNLIIIGIIEALSMMIPGISGSAILLMLGVYNIIILSFTTLKMLNILIPFIIGLIAGLFVICNILRYVIDNYANIFESLTLTFMIISVIMLLFKLASYFNTINIYQILIIPIGIYIGYAFSKI